MQHSHLTQTDTKPWYKQFWPWLIIFFPATAVVAGIATVIIAVMTDDGLVEQDYYKKGLLINFSREMDQKAATLGLDGYIRVDSASKEIYLLINNLDEKADLSNLSLTLKHATRSDIDQNIQIKTLDRQEFSAPFNELISGKWHVILESENQWRLTGSILYPSRFDSKLSPLQ
jgi:hypothetical protein